MLFGRLFCLRVEHCGGRKLLGWRYFACLLLKHGQLSRIELFAGAAVQPTHQKVHVPYQLGNSRFAFAERHQQHHLTLGDAEGSN